MRRAVVLTAVMAGLLAAAPMTASARIKLAALPVRERVEIQLDHGQYTLVEEERIVPLLKSTPRSGNNMIDFSWSNTQIDKDSIQFRPIALREADQFRAIRKVDGQEEVAVINVAYPPSENALVWEVFAKEACAVKVRVSYLIGNLNRTFAYRALADKDETLLTLTNYIQLRNYSGEEFGAAGVWAGFGKKFLEKPVGQQEDIKMLLEQFKQVPIAKTYTFDWYTHGALNPDKPLASKILMHYKLTNDEKNRMGQFPLQPGKVRIFIDDGRGGEAFLGEDWAQLTPLDGDMKLYLGEARDVVTTRIVQDNKRHTVRGNLFDQELWIKYEVENFKDKPVTLDILEQLNQVARQYGADPKGDVEWERGRDTSKTIDFTYEQGGASPILHVRLPPRPKDKDAKVEQQTFVFHFTLKNLWP
jgi:hypothetical protein